MEKLAIFIAKGGTGKTTTAVSLAAGLSADGQRVVLVDTDPQGGISSYFSIESTGGLTELLDGKEARLVRVRPNLVVIPSGNGSLGDQSLRLSGPIEQTDLFGRLFAELHDTDFVIFDCSPLLNAITQGVLAYADHVLIPVSMDYLSAVTAVNTVNAINSLPAEERPKILGILPTFYDRRTKISRVILRMLKDHFGDLVMETIIRTNTQINEAPSFKKTIFEFAKFSYGSADYSSLLDEVELRLKKSSGK